MDSDPFVPSVEPPQPYGPVEENEPPAPVTPTRPLSVPPPRVRISSEAELLCLVAERLVEDGRLSVLDQEDLKDHTCPLSLCIFRDPVIASDGQVYERSHIERHIVTNGPRSPLTNACLDHHALYPALPVRKAIVRLVWRTTGTPKEDRTTATLLAFLGLDTPPEPTLEPPPPAPEAPSPQAPGAPQRRRIFAESSRIFAEDIFAYRVSLRSASAPSMAQQAEREEDEESLPEWPTDHEQLSVYMAESEEEEESLPEWPTEEDSLLEAQLIRHGLTSVDISLLRSAGLLQSAADAWRRSTE